MHATHQCQGHHKCLWNLHPCCKELQNHWVNESPKVGNETEVERLWVVTCCLTSHQSVKDSHKSHYNLRLDLKSITDMQSVLMHIIIGSDQSWTLIYHKMHAVSNTNWQTDEQYWAIASKKSRSRELGFKSEYNTRLLESCAQGSSSCNSSRLLPVSISSNSLVK